jgi:hypothetical protein
MENGLVTGVDIPDISRNKGISSMDCGGFLLCIE